MQQLLSRLPTKLWESFWFVPILLTLVGGIGGMASISFDETEYARQLAGAAFILKITDEGGRSLVSTVAAGIVTMASLVFSLTFVALTLMSQQLGPRLIQIFLRDRFAKITFGSFTGAFLFCLVVLAVTGTGAKGQFVPIFSLLLVIGLAVFSFCLMIVYINHIAFSIQADTLIARLGNNLSTALAQFIQHEGRGTGSADREHEANQAAAVCERLDADSIKIRSDKTGYIAEIESQKLVHLLQQDDRYGKLLCRPGHFVTDEMPVLQASGLSGDSEKAVLDCFVLEPTRTFSETGEFEMNALVEVALRALSPGMNDSYTALACIDQLSSAVADLCKAPLKPRVMADDQGVARLLAYRQGLSHFLDTAFHSIRHAARDNPLVLARLVNAYRMLADLARDNESARRAVSKHLAVLNETIKDCVSTKDDRDHLVELIDRVKFAQE